MSSTAVKPRAKRMCAPRDIDDIPGYVPHAQCPPGSSARRTTAGSAALDTPRLALWQVNRTEACHR